MSVPRRLQKGHVETDLADPPSEGWWPRFVRWLGCPTESETDSVPTQQHSPEIRTRWVSGTSWVSDKAHVNHRLEDQTIHALQVWWKSYFHEDPPPFELSTDLKDLAVDSLDMLELYATLEENFNVLFDASSRPSRVDALVAVLRAAPGISLESVWNTPRA